MKTNFQKVREFHEAFELDINDEPYKDVFDKNPKLVTLRKDLIIEEVEELREAIKNEDEIETIDALADILYVTYGAGVSFGIDLDGLVRPNKSDKIILFNSKMYYIDTQVSKLLKAMNNKNMDETADALKNILCVVYCIGLVLNIDLDIAFDLVHKSNMTKLCYTTEEASLTVISYRIKYKKNGSPYDSPAYKKSSDNKYWIVYNKSTGKILKSINYKPVSFASMLNKKIEK
uniref:Phosphoribosyl-ATP pyrophosphohydrolase n=1 Tax=Mimivirus LCMiAC02 TaxID=2506609 RepID=A0A481Z176_9VIRU|nr:MAG: phosphoribosyl-ATP pyrophosphohydrolase [Mimivirus LCMiAC02]